MPGISKQDQLEEEKVVSSVEEPEPDVEEEEEEVVEEPVWKKRGFTSLEAMVAYMDGESASAKVMQSKAEEMLQKQVIGSPPQIDQTRLEEEGQAYLQEYHKATQEFYAQQGKPQAQAALLDAATEGVLTAATTLGYDKDVVYGIMRSIAQASPDKQNAALTVEGIRAIGKEALSKLEGMLGKKKEAEVPKSHKTPKGGKPSGATAPAPKKSELDAIEEKIKQAGSEGRVDDVINLVMEKQAALLKPRKGE